MPGMNSKVIFVSQIYAWDEHLLHPKTLGKLDTEYLHRG